MEIKVRYFSKSGNTRKLAEAIAEEAHCTAQDISVPLDGCADILFLGVAVFPENFYCRGQFQALYRGRPNEEDKKAARKFAADRIMSVEAGTKKK